MYSIAGHTMGTPEYSLYEAIDLFSALGMDGIEIVVQDGYECGLSTKTSVSDLEALREYAKNKHLRIICLTPYYSDYNSLDDDIRNQSIEGLKKIIRYADILGASFIRIYGGTDNGLLMDEKNQQLPEQKEKRTRLVEAMRLLGDEAAQFEITLVIENHFNTMTVSASQAASIVSEINHPHVGILYDQANLAFTGKEAFDKAIDLQKGLIRYVHVKDLIFKSEERTFSSSDVSHQKESERNVVTRIVGEGVLEWPEILIRLKSIGYIGWLSLEYERRWHAKDIPDAKIGMKKSMKYLRGCIEEMN